MAAFLSSGQRIQAEIRRIFKTERGRRVAMVAFVGNHASAYLPRPSGLELVCWPSAPGTNPKALRKLIKLGVRVRFSDRLHMKVYWTKSSGAVVTSANLSTNAFGSGSLHEAGVLLPSSAIDIDKLLDDVAPKDANESLLRKLETSWNLASKQTAGGNSGGKLTFLQWLSTPKRKPWHIFLYFGHGSGVSQRMRAAAKEETGKNYVEDCFYCRRAEYPLHSWVLAINVCDEQKPTVDKWYFVHRIVLVAKNDRHYEEGAPYQAGQLHPSRSCPPEPFKIDSIFRKALTRAIKEFHVSVEKCRTKFSSKPSKKLLDAVEKHYRKLQP